jgi:antirestriction protein ArdC
MNERTVKLKATLSELANSLITDPDQIDRFTRQWSNGFHNYSFGNLLLIMWQKRDATLCAGYQDWLEKHHRYVKKGEKGIAILAPVIHRHATIDEDGGETEESRLYFRTVHVFDVSQTDGEPLELGHSDKVAGQSDLDLDAVAPLFPYPLQYSNGIENGYTDGKTITINARGNKLSMLATYFHELAHCILDHVDGRGSHDAALQHELEAEAVSYIACAYFGIQNDRSRYYIAGWKGTKAKLHHSGTRVIRTAERIIKTIEKGGEK